MPNVKVGGGYRDGVIELSVVDYAEFVAFQLEGTIRRDGKWWVAGIPDEVLRSGWFGNPLNALAYARYCTRLAHGR